MKNTIELSADPRTYTAFAGSQRIAAGPLRDVAQKAKTKAVQPGLEPLLIFDNFTSHQIELNFAATPEQLLSRINEIESGAQSDLEPAVTEEGSRGPGRPKLGVVAREVTLLPRHWNWLATQPGGASVALRKLVESARRTNQEADRLRLAKEAAYRFLVTMAGNEPGFEEAARALFAEDLERFTAMVDRWPIDVANHAKMLGKRVSKASE